MGGGGLGVSLTPSTSKVVFGQNVDEVERACEKDASFLSTSSRTKAFIEFSMELLKDSMKEANSVMVSDVAELGPPPSWCVVCGTGGLAMGAPCTPGAPSSVGRLSP